jgi:PRTRC genetic system protein C
MPRLFVYDGREFPDPDPKLPVEDVRKQLAEFFPELANADTREEKRGEDTVYTFARRIGTKGRRPRAAVAVLRRVPAKSLRILELAAELLAGDGELDVDRAAARRPEINLAVAEARAYARATQGATAALRRLLAR